MQLLSAADTSLLFTCPAYGIMGTKQEQDWQSSLERVKGKREFPSIFTLEFCHSTELFKL